MGSCYRHLDLDARVFIETSLAQGVSLSQIARELGVHKSSVSREIKRGSYRVSEDQANYRPCSWGRMKTSVKPRHYYAATAQRTAQARAKRCHQPYKMRCDMLVDYTVNKLRDGWSLHMIAGRVRLEYPDDLRMRVCMETLYVWVHSQAQKYRGLIQYLPFGHKKRCKRTGRKVRKHVVKERVSIHERPQSVQERVVFGDWEIDSVLGKRGTGAIHTGVERVSRYLVTRLLPDTSAMQTLKAEKDWISSMPQGMVVSLTADNGHEFADHYKLRKETGVRTYFADPYSAWQRGTNERFNREVRPYLPKGSSLQLLAPVNWPTSLGKSIINPGNV